MNPPVLTLLAGPNGAGKSTYALTNLQELVAQGAFLNADDMARNLRANDVQSVAMRAGRQMLSMREAMLVEGRTFCLEQPKPGHAAIGYA